MAVFGAVGLFFENNSRKFIGYEFLHSTGILLVAIGVSAARGITLFAYLIGYRIITFSMLSWSVSFFDPSENMESIFSFGDLTRERPVVGASFLYALLSIAGMPFTIGFPPLQTLYQYLGADHPTILALMILSNTLVTVVVFKMIKGFLGKKLDLKYLIGQVRKDYYLLSILIITIVFGIFPRIILARFENLISGFTLLIK